MGLVLFALKSIVRRGHQNILAIGILAFGLFIFFIGNAILDSGTAGLAKVYRDAIIGDAAIGEMDSQPISIWGYEELFSTQFTKIPILGKSDALKKQLLENQGIASVTSLVANPTLLEVGSYRNPVYTMGVEATSFFPSRRFKFIHGSVPLSDASPWLVINNKVALAIQKATTHFPLVGETLQVTYADATGFVIRGIPLAGIVDFSVHNSALDSLILIDLPSAWDLLGLKKAEQNTSGTLTGDANSDDLFSVSDSDSIPPIEGDASGNWNSINIGKLLTAGDNQRPRNGAIQFLLVQFKKGYNFDTLKHQYGDMEKNDFIRLMDWKGAAGQGLRYVISIQQIFNMGMLLFSVLIIMIFINTIGNAIFERKAEIGVLRALGARRSKVSLVFAIEYLAVGLVSMFIAIICSGLTVWLINGSSMELNNEVLVNLFGGSVLTAIIDSSLIVKGLILSMLIPLLVVIFMSGRLASITPQQAMQNGS